MLHHFDTDLDNLKQKLLAMASHAETAVNHAVQALVERDYDLALRVKLLTRLLPGTVGAGKNSRSLCDTGFSRDWGITFPGNGVAPIATPALKVRD